MRWDCLKYSIDRTLKKYEGFIFANETYNYYFTKTIHQVSKMLAINEKKLKRENTR